MVKTDSLFWCPRCKDQKRVFQDVLNDGHGAECIMRCADCRQSTFEANSYFRDEIATETEKRRSWWFAKEKLEESKADLQAFEAMNDFKGADKARAAVAKFTKKMAECEE